MAECGRERTGSFAVATQLKQKVHFPRRVRLYSNVEKGRTRFSRRNMHLRLMSSGRAFEDGTAFLPHPTTCLFLTRAARDFGDGFVSILLPVYLLALGHSPVAVGVISTVSLLGSAALTTGVGIVGSRYDYRQLLLAAAGLMIATGIAFFVIDEFALLLVIAFTGTINPSAGSVSVFVPLEHAALAAVVGALTERRYLPDIASLAHSLPHVVRSQRACLTLSRRSA